jgi:hypothetical protein
MVDVVVVPVEVSAGSLASVATSCSIVLLNGEMRPVPVATVPPEPPDTQTP